MGIKFKIGKIILEVEYILLILVCICSISQKIYSFFDKYYICLLFVIFHELSHVLVGCILNKKVSKIFMGISGMTAFFKYDFNNRNRLYYIRETIIYLAGPISNILIAYFFKDINFVFEVNIFLAILNLLPIYPLDGFNILKCFLCTININNKYTIYKVLKYVSLLLMFALSIVCIRIFFKFNNVFSIIFLIYILLINIKNK